MMRKQKAIGGGLVLGLVLALGITFHSSSASAFLFGAYAQGQVGYVSSAFDVNDLAYGFSVGGQLLGVQLFLDNKFFFDKGRMAELGLGYQLGLPLPILDFYVRPAIGFMHMVTPYDGDGDWDEDRLWGLHGSFMAGADYKIAPLIYAGVQTTAGYVYTTEQEQGEHVSVMFVLRAKI